MSKPSIPSPQSMQPQLQAYIAKAKHIHTVATYGAEWKTLLNEAKNNDKKTAEILEDMLNMKSQELANVFHYDAQWAEIVLQKKPILLQIFINDLSREELPSFTIKNIIKNMLDFLDALTKIHRIDDIYRASDFEHMMGVTDTGELAIEWKTTATYNTDGSVSHSTVVTKTMPLPKPMDIAKTFEKVDERLNTIPDATTQKALKKALANYDLLKKVDFTDNKINDMQKLILSKSDSVSHSAAQATMSCVKPDNKSNKL